MQSPFGLLLQSFKNSNPSHLNLVWSWFAVFIKKSILSTFKLSPPFLETDSSGPFRIYRYVERYSDRKPNCLCKYILARNVSLLFDYLEWFIFAFSKFPGLPVFCFRLLPFIFSNAFVQFCRTTISDVDIGTNLKINFIICSK